MLAPDNSAELHTKITAARSRLVFGHVPAASITGGVFAIIVAALVSQLQGWEPDLGTLAWVTLTVVVSLARTVHAIAYLKMRHARSQAHWRPGFIALTMAFGFCWASTVWVLPIDIHPNLSATLVGAVIGISATGAAMLNADQIGSRVWIGPILVSTSAYCANYGGPFGTFGLVAVTGFMVILWFDATRSHRRVGELLRHRFASDDVAQAQAIALEEANKLNTAKSRFLASMSHEMRTPLHGVLGLSRLIQPHLREPAAQRHMHLLQNTGMHLLGVINDVLDFSRLNEGLMTLRPVPTNLSATILEVVELSNVNAIEKDLSVTIDSNLPNPCWVRVDASRLQQVLINLTGNAVKFTQQGHVRVVVRQTATDKPHEIKVRFEVQDTGPGIPPEQLSQIFDAFHQADNGFDRRVQGSGLGLSIAQQICQAMGSQITCTSQLGQGSTFSFEVRYESLQHTPPPSVQVRGLVAQHSRGQALLVEDNPVNIIVAQAGLESMGWTVAVADNGMAALAWLAQNRADLILMDCHMPGMNGFETTKKIREVERLAPGGRHTPILALTASIQSDDLQQCHEVGMDGHLSKPFTQQSLELAIEQVLKCPESTT